MEKTVCQSKDEFDEFMYLNAALMRNGLYKIGLYAGQPIILDAISRNPGLTQKMLADMGGIKPSTINVMLSRMAKNELVEIRKDKENSKLSRVYITEKGEKLSNKALSYKNELQKSQFKGFSEEEIKEFKSMLQRININLQTTFEEEN